MKLKVLVVDDSATSRKLLNHIINSAPDMQVAGEAVNGVQAVSMTEQMRPDVILMDLIMPEMDGLEATREIMLQTPTPIVVISASLENSETDIAFRAINSGALAVQPKPGSPEHPEYYSKVSTLLTTLRAMSKVQVIHHWGSRGNKPATLSQATVTVPTPAARPEVIAIASSTGGPAALSEIMKNLSKDFPIPILIAQHIAPDFVPSLANWLNSVGNTHVTIAQSGDLVRPGVTYLSPGGAHLTVTQNCRIYLDRNQSSARYVPSGDVLLDSVARAYGSRAVGVVLTGMGDDGSRGLRAMFSRGAMTVAQDEASSVVFSMPHEAIKLGVVKHVLPPPEIAQFLNAVSQIGVTP